MYLEALVCDLMANHLHKNPLPPRPPPLRGKNERQQCLQRRDKEEYLYLFAFFFGRGSSANRRLGSPVGVLCSTEGNLSIPKP